jgi:hypothetical protein
MTTLNANVRPTPGMSRIAMASLVGTTIEFYDFYIYGTAAALIIGPVFFAAASPRRRRSTPSSPSASRSWRGRSARRCSAISAIALAGRPRSWPHYW